MKKNTFNNGLNKTVAAIEAAVIASNNSFFDAIEEANDLVVDPEVVLAARAAAVAAALHEQLDDNMNPQKWA